VDTINRMIQLMKAIWCNNE